MAHTDSLFFPRSTFDAFLYAAVGVEENGMELSVVSALARFVIFMYIAMGVVALCFLSAVNYVFQQN